MNREVHVRLWESAGVRFHCATHLPPCLRERERCPRRHRPIHQLLQLAPAALKPSSSNSGRGVLRIAASAFGQSSLTPQGPLKNYRDLFRSTAPALSDPRSGVSGGALSKSISRAAKYSRVACSATFGSGTSRALLALPITSAGAHSPRHGASLASASACVRPGSPSMPSSRQAGSP